MPRQDRYPHDGTAALDSANTVATTSTRAPTGNAQFIRTRTRFLATTAAASTVAWGKLQLGRVATAFPWAHVS